VGNTGRARASGDGDLATQVVRGRRAATSGARARATLQTRQRGHRRRGRRCWGRGRGRLSRLGNAGRASRARARARMRVTTGDGVGGEGVSPDLATQVRRRASGARARAARTQDDRRRGATLSEGECEGVGRGLVPCAILSLACYCFLYRTEILYQESFLFLYFISHPSTSLLYIILNCKFTSGILSCFFIQF